MDYKVLVDTQEKVGWWEFPNHERTHLKTGDYTIAGYEDLLCLERKRTTGEIAINCSEARFTRELERMQAFKYKYLMFEFSMDDILRFPVGSTIPKNRWNKLRINSEYLMKFYIEVSVHYGIQVMFCGDRENAMIAATKIMNRVIKDNAKER
jgi:hypothetical protein